MNYKTILTNLYYLLIQADGHVSEGEIALGKRMVSAEGIREVEFKTQLDLLKMKHKSVIYTECLVGIKKLNRQQQIRSIAWLCVIANADGFMDKTEWQFIYKIYHKELNLPLNDIMKVQKELNPYLNGSMRTAA
jgi:uncharacterized tellurite resistance protein B-like protein